MPSSRRPIIVLSLIGLAALAGYAWHVNRAPAPATAQSAAAPDTGAGGGSGGGAQAAPIVVETHTVQTRALADDVSALGSLVSNESVVLRPEVSGRIETIRFRDGETVRRGAVLVELDSAVERAELQQARADLTLAESNFRRTQDLFGRKFVSQSSLDDARAKLEVARAGLALAQARLARMQIRAPFDGVVGIRYSPQRIFNPQEFPSGGAGMAGTAEDFMRLLEALRQGQGAILPNELIEEMARDRTTNMALPNVPGFGFGLGFSVLRDPTLAASPESEGTWRWGGAYGHSWFVDRAQGLSVVAFTNTLYEGMSGRFVTDLRDAVYGAPGTER